jgi:hypothetical protein
LKEIAEDSSISCSSCGAQMHAVAIKDLNEKRKINRNRVDEP